MLTSVLLLAALSTVLVDRRHHAFAAPGASGAGQTARSLKEIEHVVIFMQENRSFNHVCPSPLLAVLEEPET